MSEQPPIASHPPLWSTAAQGSGGAELHTICSLEKDTILTQTVTPYSPYFTGGGTELQRPPLFAKGCR